MKKNGLNIQVNMKKNNNWIEYTGEYEKEWYDIELYHGEVVYECYPNAGTFHSSNGKEYKGVHVRNIKRCKHPLD